MDGTPRLVFTVAWPGSSLEPRQFALAPVDEEVLMIGRGPDCDIVLKPVGVSTHHLELFVIEESKNDDQKSQQQVGGSSSSNFSLYLRDMSTNGTGVRKKDGAEWKLVSNKKIALREGNFQLLVPFHRNQDDPDSRKDRPVMLYVHVLGGDLLPDPLDERTKHGRWRYLQKLGEGAIGFVYSARDSTGKLGPHEVAIKTCKNVTSKSKRKPGAHVRGAWCLHREAHWSLCRLHCAESERFLQKRSMLFAKYLEDHTGPWWKSKAKPEDFENERDRFENPNFPWDEIAQTEPGPQSPYVVMEFIPGTTLTEAMGWSRGKPGLYPPLSKPEKLYVLNQCTKAAEYLNSWGLIHRDLRPANLMICGRGQTCTLKVIDLGHMLANDDRNQHNKSMVIRCHWHKETDKKKFDWAPPEVKLNESALNFEMPTHAFDIFSIGALAVQLCSGKPSASKDVAKRASQGAAFGAADLGLRERVLRSMLAETATKRPTPHQVLEALHIASMSMEKGSVQNGKPHADKRSRPNVDKKGISEIDLALEMEVDDDEAKDEEGRKAEKKDMQQTRLSLLGPRGMEKESDKNEGPETPEFDSPCSPPDAKRQKTLTTSAEELITPFDPPAAVDDL